jgi:hypothetical protein
MFEVLLLVASSERDRWAFRANTLLYIFNWIVSVALPVAREWKVVAYLSLHVFNDIYAKNKIKK